MRSELERSIAILAERTTDNRKDISQKNRQRRNQVTDLYGVEYQRDGSSGNPATFWISISTDMLYLERFQCKIMIIADTMPKNLRVYIEDVDVTAYMMAQQDGQWIDQCDGVTWFPSNDPVEGGDDDFDDAYDFLEIAGTMIAEGNDDQAETILKPDFKKVRIFGEGSFTAVWMSYLKYSHVNR